MADVLRLSGSIGIAPSSGTPSGHASLTVALDEQMSLDHARANLHYLLATDAAKVVDLDSLSVSFVLVRATAKVKVRITSADGATQAIPGTFLVIRTEDVPITAIDITRQPGIETQVDVTIGILPS